MASISQLRRELRDLKNTIGPGGTVDPALIPGLLDFREAKKRQRIITDLTGETVGLSFEPSEYGRTLAYFEACDLRAFDPDRDRTRTAEEMEKLDKKLLDQLNALATSGPMNPHPQPFRTPDRAELEKLSLSSLIDISILSKLSKVCEAV